MILLLEKRLAKLSEPSTRLRIKHSVVSTIVVRLEVIPKNETLYGTAISRKIVVRDPYTCIVHPYRAPKREPDL